ncbi:MAG TPA: glycoside hydrolase family 18 protein, partial [Phycisphaerae bacterium]|nr:glycoside hydrolase family 18 protein [Phycisphaerae bacterium]
MPWEPPHTNFPTPQPQQPQQPPAAQKKPSQPIRQQNVSDEHRMLGGYYSWCKAQPFNKICFDNYNYIVHAFLAAGSDGKLQYNPARKIPSAELTALAHRNNVKIIISLGGGRNNYFDKITASRWATGRLVASAI